MRLLALGLLKAAGKASRHARLRDKLMFMGYVLMALRHRRLQKFRTKLFQVRV